jgi:mannose-6-phosphate isomerase-like protein (cupin superfamily)
METLKEERQVAPIANTAEEWRGEMERMAQRKVPSFFHIRARLPKQGRTNQVLGASTHVFVVLQGGASFYGPKGERRDVKKNDCVLVPAGAFYWFQADESEPLVMLRIGATLDAAKDVLARIDLEGNPFDGYSEKNKEVPIVLEEDKWFE